MVGLKGRPYIAMTFEEYQKKSRKTAMYPKTMPGQVEPIYLYPTLGLAGEAGEVVEKVKKLVRNNEAEITEEFRQGIGKELGDVLWYVSQLATDLDLSLEEIAKLNINKARSRMERGVLHKPGGDDR
ncbi:MAG: nucleoside triphosphate pyrophosphohydrolase family protein [Patescibacteria group bacterium]|nr:nucleoside triphosphate pyrophosphohydrolase family protein [Patescibacteria group bacterium]